MTDSTTDGKNTNAASDDKGSSREVAELRQRIAELEKRERESDARLRETDKRTDEFIATVAHELRNPLAPVRNAMHILRVLDPSAPEVGQAHDIIERQVEQLTRIVDDLLDLSRIARGQVVLQREDVDLREVLEAAVETSQTFIESRRHNLELALPKESITLDADFTRLAQVFSNLLNNAAKYTSQGGRIGITSRLDGDHVEVTVSDNGIGIANDQLSHVFDMRPHVSAPGQNAHQGIGIGLALVKHLLALHGGEVTARSAGLGKGSEFVVRLPVKEVHSAEADEDSDIFVMDMDSSAGPAVRVLLAEDDHDSALSLGLLLEHYGCSTRVVYDGLTALSVAAEFHPQVVLLDLSMPGLDGWETCRRMRAEPWGANALIIALTGWGQEEDRRRTMEAGFDHHLLKPVHVTSLLDLFAGRATV